MVSMQPRKHAAPASSGLPSVLVRVEFGHSAWATLRIARWSLTGTGIVAGLFALPAKWCSSIVVRPFAVRWHAAHIVGLLPAIRDSGLASPHEQRAFSPTRRAAITFRRSAPLGSGLGNLRLINGS